MATTITCGTTGRDYSTLQAAEDAIPATPTGGYIVDCYNDSEFSARLLVTGHTTSAANYITFRAANGQSFVDHANVRTNPLDYDQTKGVGLSATTDGFNYVLEVGNDYVTIERFQIKITNTSGSMGAAGSTSFYTGVVFRECIIVKDVSSTTMITVRMMGNKLINCVIIDKGTNAYQALTFQDTGGTCLNNTVVRSGSAAGTGMTAGYGGPAVKNTAVFGFTTAFGATFSGSSYNGTDAASAPGTNNQTSKTYANQFESTTNDFRLKAGADLIGTGNTDATNAPNDISGTARDSGTAGDIGAWEYSVAAGGGDGLLMGQIVY